MANCSSQPCAVRSSPGSAMMPALLTRMCSGSGQSAAKRRTEAGRRDRARRTWTARVAGRGPHVGGDRSPASGRRTARVTCGAGGGERPGGLDADAGAAAGDDGAARRSRSTPARTSLGGGVEAEGGGDAGHRGTHNVPAAECTFDGRAAAAAGSMVTAVARHPRCIVVSPDGPERADLPDYTVIQRRTSASSSSAGAPASTIRPRSITAIPAGERDCEVEELLDQHDRYMGPGRAGRRSPGRCP